MTLNKLCHFSKPQFAICKMELIVEVVYEINIGKMFSRMLAPSAQEINGINIILQSALDTQRKEYLAWISKGKETFVLGLC